MRFLVLLLLLPNSWVFSQIVSVTNVYGKLDTLKCYSVSLTATHQNGKDEYSLNNKKISAEDYQHYHQVWHNIGLCKPCYLQVYDENEILIRTSVQYTDCPVGEWKEYYPDGKIKIEGQYKQNSSGDWQNISQNGYCRQVGAWKYYDTSGNVIKTETY